MKLLSTHRLGVSLTVYLFMAQGWTSVVLVHTSGFNLLLDVLLEHPVSSLTRVVPGFLGVFRCCVWWGSLSVMINIIMLCLLT